MVFLGLGLGLDLDEEEEEDLDLSDSLFDFRGGRACLEMGGGAAKFWEEENNYGTLIPNSIQQREEGTGLCLWQLSLW